jgi:TatD DNase family protein
LAPAPNRGKRNEPAYIKIVAEKLASILNLPLDLIEKSTTQNALQLFNLASDE